VESGNLVCRGSYFFSMEPRSQKGDNKIALASTIFSLCVAVF
jgi:hypothetical protein